MSIRQRGWIGPGPPNSDFVLNRESPQAKGLRLWFPPLATRSGFLRDLILGDRGILENGAIYVSDRFLGRAIYVNSTTNNQCVNILDKSSLDVVEPFSMTTWCIPYFTNGTGGLQYAKIVTRPSTNDGTPYVVYSLGSLNLSPNRFTFGISTDAGGSQEGTGGTVPFVAYQPFFVCGTYDKITMRLYVNGFEDATNVTNIGVGVNSEPLILGRLRISGPPANNFFWGLIGDTRIYDRVLSPSEIYDQYDPATRWDLYRPITPTLWPVGIGIQGDTTWGHDTGVIEVNIRDFSGNWAGTGAIAGAGDAETLELEITENMVSEVVDTGIYTVLLFQNLYDALGDDVTMEYRHGATKPACLGAAYQIYAVPFESLGFVQIRLTATQAFKVGTSKIGSGDYVS